MSTVDIIDRVYQECQGAWIGLDWTTDYGPWGWDLNGYTGEKLRALAADFKAGKDIPLDWGREDKFGNEIAADDNALRQIVLEELDDAAEFIDQVTSDAGAAAEAAAEAMKAIHNGDLNAALEFAEYACWVESQYGDCPVWGPFRSAIKTAIEEQVQGQ